jgi:thiamine pyrophosphate-dependent acetolactate synthase large subunit-like protein
VPAQPVASGKLPITAVVAELEALLPGDRMVIVDGGLFMYFAVDGISVPDPASFVWTLDFGSIGLGLPMGIGTALARPDRRCVVIAGDGGLVMSIQELETAAREHVPLTVVVLNDAAYGAEVRFLEANGKLPKVATFEDVNFSAVAQAFGARGVTVRTLEELKGVREALTPQDGPVVIDIKVAQEEDHRYLKFLEVMKAGATAVG